MDEITNELLDELDRYEANLLAGLLNLLKRVRRDCSPEFADRVETYLRSNDLLPPNDNARQ